MMQPGYTTRILTIGGFEHSGPAGRVRPVSLGGGHPVVIQTMWKDRLSFADLENERWEALSRRIEMLGSMGCGLLRFAVPDLEAAEILGELASRITMPVCADIHFDHKIALRCLDFPIAKLRINPGNIGGRKRVEAVAAGAGARGVPIRIGVNAGSLPAGLREQVNSGRLDRAGALVEAALAELAVLEEVGFRNTAVSMKASGIADTIRANRLFAGRSDVPLHIGVTEAGPLTAGTVLNTAALLTLLGGGIGDTIRVSLSDTPENEVIAGREILRALRDLEQAGDRAGRQGAAIVSCPRCGRNTFDTHAFTGRWMERLYALDKDCTIAVMGCAVNGPGEAKYADLGITGAGNSILIFRHGVIERTIGDCENLLEEADKAFEEELKKL